MSAYFSRVYLKQVMETVRRLEPDVKVSKAVTWMSSGERKGAKRAHTFDYEGFHFDGWALDAYEGKADAWLAWLRHKGHSDDEIGKED